jgi:hypothetical protein
MAKNWGELLKQLRWYHAGTIPVLLIGMIVISVVASFLTAVVTGAVYLAHGLAFVLGVRL